MLSRRLYQVFGLACGFALIDYGFSAGSIGLPGVGTFTAQFLAINLILGGSILIFVSLYFLLKPVSPAPTGAVVAQPAGPRPDLSVELVVEEQTPPKPGFYKTIEYIGYFFALVGLISAADLVMQVFIRSTYNEARWWVEVLLVTFGVLSYTIFGSVGRLGSQEEAKLTIPAAEAPLKLESPSLATLPVAPTVTPAAGGAQALEPLTLRLTEFSRTSEAEYEKHSFGDSYDMFRVDPEMVTVWRESRRGMRSLYLAGPYELSRKLLEEYLKNGEELRVGDLVLSTETIRGLLELSKLGRESGANVSAQPAV